MPNVSILVLSFFPDLFASVYHGIETHATPGVRKILVRDGGLIPAPDGWLTIQAPEPFVFTRNANLGIKAAGTDDIILIGDDVNILSPFVTQLQEAVYANPIFAIAVPDLKGQSMFNFCYIKREVFDKVGLLDEDFNLYGYDDNDFAARFMKAGYRDPVTIWNVQAFHSGTASYIRKNRNVTQELDEMQALWNKKHGEAK